ncbi:MAG: CPBP family glutamic-type intramembrane protease [Chloroflexota bacterium]
MARLSVSTRIYIGLVLVLALLAGVSIYLPTLEGLMPPAEELPAPKPVLALANAGIVLVAYGLLGGFGLKLSRKIGLPEIWDAGVSNRQRFLTPALIGSGLGVFLIISDIIFASYNGIGRLVHPPFPTSILASLSAGIGEELLFRLFFIPFWVWLISHLILKGRGEKKVFWTVSVVSALAFALGHIPALMLLFGFKSVSHIPPALMLEIILLNGVVALFCAYYFKKYGYLAAAGIHFWTDVVWHVVWGLF